jgi:hypothetical protein
MISAAGLMGIIGAVILGVVLTYAIFRNRNRNPRNEQIGEAAAREQYQNPNGYNPDEFKEKLVPNPDGTVPKSD